MAVLLETTLGDIVIDLFTEERPKSKTWRWFEAAGTFEPINCMFGNLFPGVVKAQLTFSLCY